MQDMQQEPDEAPEKGEESESEGTIMHIPSSVLPPGVKEGDLVQFYVAGPPDESGDVPVKVNAPKAKDEDESWEEGLMKHMSPRGGEEAQ